MILRHYKQKTIIHIRSIESRIIAGINIDDFRGCLECRLQNKIIIIFEIIFILVLLLTPMSSFGKNNYFTIDYNFSALIDESDYHNGLTGKDIGFSVGHYFKFGGLELFYKGLELNDNKVLSAGTFDITIKDKIIGIGFRFNIFRYGVIKLGYATHKIKATYNLLGSTYNYKSTVDGNHQGFYLGLGYRAIIMKQCEFYHDFELFQTSSNLTLLNMALGLRIII